MYQESYLTTNSKCAFEITEKISLSSKESFIEGDDIVGNVLKEKSSPGVKRVAELLSLIMQKQQLATESLI